MDPARCRAFLSSVETGSFTRAAETLGYTPSGVSQLVHALEKELGFPLLLRSKHGVTPTANGEMILPAIRDFLLQENRIWQTAADIKGLTTGSVTIASYSSIATHWLPDVIKSFEDEHPRIHIKLMDGIRQEVTKWLDSKEADVGFFSYQEPMKYEWIPLAEDRMLAVLPGDHPLAGADSFPIARCAEESFVMPALGRDADVLALLERNHIRPNIRFSTLDSYAALMMISKGLGMSVMNELITRNWACDAVMLPLDPPQQITLGIGLLSLKNAAPAVRKFVDFSVRRLTRGQR